MAAINAIGLALGSSWASGINLYAAAATLGILGTCGVELPGELSVLQSPWVIGVASLLYCIEFVADKVPWFDSIWDGVHTFIRPPAGAAMAYLSMGDYPVGAEIAAALVGGSVALSSHGTKAATRAIANTSPEPFTNWALSIIEDIGVIGVIVLAIVLPIVAVMFVVAFVVAVIWLAPKIWRLCRRVLRFGTPKTVSAPRVAAQ